MDKSSLAYKRAATRKHEARRKEIAGKRERHDRHLQRQVEKLIQAFGAFDYLGGGPQCSLLDKLRQIGVETEGINLIATSLAVGKDKRKARETAKREYGTARAALSRRKTRKPNKRYVEIGFRRLTTELDYKTTDRNNLDRVTLAVWQEVREASGKNCWGLVGQLLEVAGYTEATKADEDRARHFRRLEDRTRKRVTEIFTA